MDVSEHCMYQNANSCTIALSEPGTALFEGGTLSKTCLYHVQTCMYNVHTMFKHVHTITCKLSDGMWSVVVNLYRHVCTMSIHIFTFMYMYVHCTYKYINSCTCIYMYVHMYKCMLMYIHVHTCSWIYVQVQTCMYNVQQPTYRFAISCPGGKDSRCLGGMTMEQRAGCIQLSVRIEFHVGISTGSCNGVE